MAEKLVLVTGACGEIGQALVQRLAKQGGYRIITADLAPLPDHIKAISAEHAQGDLVYKIKTFYDYDFDIIFHLAASLSSKAEVASEEPCSCSCWLPIVLKNITNRSSSCSQARSQPTACPT